jgi:hypothetical protein
MAMLGGECSPCCGCASGVCLEGSSSLPETVTVKLGEIPYTIAQPLIAAKVSSCGGGGGAIISIQGTTGDPTAEGFPEAFQGPITGAKIVNGGADYATLGRVAPTLTVTGSGEGGIFTVTLAATTDACGLPAWKVAGVVASGDLEGYEPDELLVVTKGPDDTELEYALLYYTTQRASPTVTASASGGSGAVFEVTLARRTPFIPQSFRVQSVSVSGGDGYTDGQAVTFTAAAGDTVVLAATASLVTKLVPPTGSFLIASSGGSGATLSAPLFTELPFPGSRLWGVDGDGGVLDSSIVNAGQGYAVGDTVSLTIDDGVVVEEFSAIIDIVGPNGEIVGIIVDLPGSYYLDTGEPVSVNVTGGGHYYRDVDGNVHIENPGLYYREDETVPRLARTIVIALEQTPPSDGEGAVLVPAVDLEPGSETYGQITEVVVEEGGDGYMAFLLARGECATIASSSPIVLERFGTCEYRAGPCLLGLVFSFGAAPVPVLSAQLGDQTLIYYADSATIADCKSFSVKLEHESGATATVSSGGDLSSNPVIERFCPAPATLTALGLTVELPAGGGPGVLHPGGPPGQANPANAQAEISCGAFGQVGGGWSIQAVFYKAAGDRLTMNLLEGTGDDSVCPSLDEAAWNLGLTDYQDWAFFFTCNCTFAASVFDLRIISADTFCFGSEYEGPVSPGTVGLSSQLWREVLWISKPKEAPELGEIVTSGFEFERISIQLRTGVGTNQTVNADDATNTPLEKQKIADWLADGSITAADLDPDPPAYVLVVNDQ